MANSLFDGAQQILIERLVWETRIRRYYQMRFGGQPRRDKTKVWQADLWSATIDRKIRENKPFWLGQVTAGDRLCNFTALTQQTQEESDAAADYYDFETNTKSKLIHRINTAVDHMLLKGRGIILSTIDPMDGYRIVDVAKDPMYILMPKSANDFEDADEWIDIDLMTVKQYRMLDDRWDTSEDTVKRIRGNKQFGQLSIYQQEVELREGITHTNNENYVLVFKHWTKTASGHDISYYSPHSPDIELRKTHQNPYKYKGRESIPYNSCTMEIVEDGWYAPRGLGELLESQEQLETYIENMWADAMCIGNKRILTGDKEIQNMANLRLEDGQYIPGNLKSVQFSPPSMPWDDMLQYQRARSDEIAQTPSTSSTSPDSKTGGKAITATESNNIAALTQVGMNYAAEIFRRNFLQPLHEHRWSMICQFKDRDFAYYAAQELKMLPEQVLHDKYLIQVDGSPDGWNRNGRIQREISFMNTFAPLPNADADYWVERAMRAVDGQAAREGFKGMGMKQADEYEAQASEILLLTNNPPFPVQVQPQQDQLTRVKCNLDWFTATHGMGTPVNPMGIQKVMENTMQRIQILQKQNPAAAKQVMDLMRQMEQMVSMKPAGHMTPQTALPLQQTVFLQGMVT